MLNTRKTGDAWRSHPGNFGNGTAYCASIVRAVNKVVAADVSERRFGLVFDYYHMHMQAEPIPVMTDHYGDICDYVHVAGAYSEGSDIDISIRSEIHLPGQRIDLPVFLSQLMEKKESMTVCLEYIPFYPDKTEANMGHAIAYLKTWRDQ